MRVVELSNHPSAMLREERKRLEQERQRSEQANARWFEEVMEGVERANAQAQAVYEVELAQHEAEIQRLREEHDAFPARHWWKRLRSGSRLRKAARRAPLRPGPLQDPPPPDPAPPSQMLSISKVAKLAAGIEAEELVADSLSEAFGDEWTLLRGYRNRRGEVDQLLLGPVGLIAIEVKHRNATVYVNGDEWRFEKFDKYGNLVEEGLMTDRSGRSPSQQLRQPVGELEEFLARRGQPVVIDPVVMLSHPRAKIGHCENLTVTIAYEVDYLIGLIGGWETRLEPGRLLKIEQLIVKDHEFHEERSGRRGPSSLSN